MTNPVTFTLDGKTVTAAADETIWEVAKREGTRIPHLCHVDLPGYRPDGNCRACMVVRTDRQRANKSREMVFELLASNMRPAQDGPDAKSAFWQWASSMGI